MKKTVGVILAIAILAAAGIILFSRTKVGVTELKAEDLIPAGALVYISQREIGRDWGELKASDFWKELTSSEWWQKGELQLQGLEREMKSKWGLALNEDDIMEIFGREAALTLLPGEGEDLRPRGLFLARVGMKTKVQERLAKMQDSLFGQEKLRSETYEGVEITTLKTSSPGLDLSYAFLGDWLVLGAGSNDSVLKEVVGIYRDGSRMSLAEDESFRKVRSRLPEERAGLFYVNMEKILAVYPEGIREGLLRREPLLKELSRRTSTSLEILKTMGGVTWFDKGLKAKFYLLINRKKASESLLDMYAWKPRKSESIKYIPKGTVVYAGNSSFDDVGTYWKYLQGTLKEQNPLAAERIFRGMEKLEKEWGLSLESDILSWVGNEFAYALTDVNMKGGFPLPGYFLMLKVRDDKKARETLGKVENIIKKISLEKGLPFPLTFGGENYEGEEIKVLQVPVLTPGYAFVNDFLIVSTDTSTIKKLIDTKKGKEDSLVEDANFKRVKSIFGEKSNSLCYLNVEKTLDIIHSLAGWSLSMQERQLSRMKNRKASLESREFETPEDKERELRACQGRLDKMEKDVSNLRDNLEKGVYPLLESLKVFKSLGINVLTDKEGTEQIFYLAVDEE